MTPPDRLFHGTTHAAARFIVDEGLKKMDRDFVHLSANQAMADSGGQASGSATGYLPNCSQTSR